MSSDTTAQGTAAGMQIAFVVEPERYLDTVDPLFKQILFGEFNDNGFTVPTSPLVQRMILDMIAGVKVWQFALAVVLYLLVYLYALIIDFMTIVCCCKAMYEPMPGTSTSKSSVEGASQQA